MDNKVTVLIAEDDKGHADLIKRNLCRSGIHNNIVFFEDGQEVIDFLFKQGDGPHIKSGMPYVLLMDIRMPKIDGVEVLSRIKKNHKVKKLPVIMISTMDDPKEVNRCHALGCNNYLIKPVDSDKFIHSMRNLGGVPVHCQCADN